MSRRSPIVRHHSTTRAGFLGGRIARFGARAAVCALVVLLAGCGGDSRPGPGPTPIPPPTISCPADVAATWVPGQQTIVTYSMPTTSDGAPPVTVSCTPGPGSSFNPGVSDVACTATDAQSRTATCGFKVTVTEVPQIEKVKFLAFGDSVTEGTVSTPCSTWEGVEVPWHLLAVDAPASYPYKLQALLASRYSSQTITVVNEGSSRQRIASSGEQSRFADVLAANTPEVLLLLHGFNDLLNAARLDTVDDELPRIAGALEDVVKRARARNTTVLLANMPAMNASGCRGQLAPHVPRMNQAIRRVAADEGATLVDLYNGLGASPAGVIGIDGLHPTEEGYTKMAQVWFDAIQREFEKPPSTTAVGQPFAPPPADRIR